jgi:nucleotide-binding universal stress UspA family protein
MAGTAYGVLVGYDGSAGSDRALSWAAREAKSRGTVLTVCLAWTEWYDARRGSAQPPGGGVADHARRAAEQVAVSGLRAAQNLLGDQDVRLLVVYGSPAGVLCDHSAAADMVVVGSRGRGGMSGLLLGSVGLQVAAHAPGRVVVVRGHWWRNGYVPGPVVLGADGSACSKAAAAFAFEEAVLRHAPLAAVCALADARRGAWAAQAGCRKDSRPSSAGWRRSILRLRCCVRSRPAARGPRCWPRRTAPSYSWLAPGG